jgi:hypothetical protein
LTPLLKPRAKEFDSRIWSEASAPLQGLTVRSGTLDVGTNTACYVVCLLLAHVFHALGRDADAQTTWREFLILRHQSARGDDGALPYPRAVEDGGSHAYEAATFYRAAVHDRVVADYAVLADYGRVAGVCVQDAAVLDVGVAHEDVRLLGAGEKRLAGDQAQGESVGERKYRVP